MICVICSGGIDQGCACEQCRVRLDATLAEILELYAQLPTQFEPGRSGRERITGSCQAALPIRVDPLDLSLPAPSGRARTAAVHDQYGDQVGYVAVAAELDSWAREWREVRAQGECQPVPVVSTLIIWLRRRLDWACASHPAIDEFNAAMRQLKAALRRVLGQTKSRDEALTVPCRECELLSLTRPAGDDRVYCDYEDCGLILTGEEYRRWVGLLAARFRNAA